MLHIFSMLCEFSLGRCIRKWSLGENESVASNGSFTCSAASFINCSCDSNTCCSQHTTPPKTNSVSFHFRVHVKKKTKQNDFRARHVENPTFKAKSANSHNLGVAIVWKVSPIKSTIFCRFRRSTSNKPKPSWLPRSDLNLVVLGWITKLHLQEIGQSSVLHLDLCLRNTVVWRTRNGNRLIQFPKKKDRKTNRFIFSSRIC